MKELFELFAPWGLGGILAGGNLVAIFIITTKTIPQLTKEFRQDIAAARVDYLQSLRIERKLQIHAIMRIEKSSHEHIKIIAQDILKISSAVEMLLSHAGRR